MELYKISGKSHDHANFIWYSSQKSGRERVLEHQSQQATIFADLYLIRPSLSLSSSNHLVIKMNASCNPNVRSKKCISSPSKVALHNTIFPLCLLEMWQKCVGPHKCVFLLKTADESLTVQFILCRLQTILKQHICIVMHSTSMLIY